jgi:8-oxo-dGTP pyrophosphatase MutT (NUDIX family)
MEEIDSRLYQQNSHLISSDLQNLNEIDKLAQEFSSARNWGMGAFIAVFDPSLESVLLVKTGQYAKDAEGGTPWSLPGGAVEPGEAPSHAAIRELWEETGLSMASELHIVAWLTRPYFRSRHKETSGELILLFVGLDRTRARGLRAAPPEIVACGFHHFNIDDWLRIPARGEGEHPLAPLPRHWIYWTFLAQRVLMDPKSPITIHEYPDPASMSFIPTTLRSTF